MSEDIVAVIVRDPGARAVHFRARGRITRVAGPNAPLLVALVASALVGISTVFLGSNAIPASLSLTGGLLLHIRPKLVPGLLLGATALLPIVPDRLSTSAVAFSGLVALTILTQAKTWTLAATCITSLLFFLGATAVYADVAAQDFVRGAIPFVFLLTVVVWTNVRLRTVLYAAISGGVILSLRAFVVAANVARSTYASLDFILPIPLVGSVACAAIWMYPSGRSRHRWVVIGAEAIQLLAIAMTQTFGLIIATALAHIVLLLTRPGKRSLNRLVGIRRRVVAVAVIAIGAVAVLILASPRLLTGSAGASLQGREAEFRIAWSISRAHIMIGNGLGYKFMDPIANASAPVGYVHNVIGYFLIVGGMIAVSLYVSVWLIAIVSVRGQPGLRRAFVVAALIGIGAFALSSAVFRSIQFNVWLACLVGLAMQRPRQTAISEVAATDVRT